MTLCRSVVNSEFSSTKYVTSTPQLGVKFFLDK